MTIKKNNPAAAAAPAPGGATITDRFKLNAPAASDSGAGVVSKPATFVALLAGLIALHVAVLLTYMLFRHWEFLVNA